MTRHLPPGWTERRASQLCSLITSGSRGWAKYYADTGAGFIRVQNIRRGRIDLDLDDLQHVRPPSNAEGSRTRLKARDITITITADLGRVGLVDDAFGEAYVNQHVALARPTNAVEPAYMAWFITGPDAQEQLGLLDRGATRSGLGLKDIQGLAVPLPPLAEQRRIVARIEALFARTRRARADLERIAPMSRRHRDRTLANAFDIGTPTPVAELASAVFDGPFGSNLKSDDYTASGARVVRLENIGHLRFIGDKETFITDEKADGLRRHHLHPDDVLFSSFIDKEVRVCLFPPGQPTNAINKADCFCVRVDPKRADPRYVALRLASPVTYDDVRDAVHGATRPRISITDLKQYVINAPSLAEQTSIADRVERQHGMSNAIHREATRALALLDRLEQSILARAFRGELVPVHPSDTVPDAAPVSASPTSVSPRRLQRVSA